MKIRIKHKIEKKWAKEFGFRINYFISSRRNRRSEIVADLHRQLDSAMEYYYGRYCR